MPATAHCLAFALLLLTTSVTVNQASDTRVPPLLARPDAEESLASDPLLPTLPSDKHDAEPTHPDSAAAGVQDAVPSPGLTALNESLANQTSSGNTTDGQQDFPRFCANDNDCIRGSECDRRIRVCVYSIPIIKGTLL